MPVQTSFGRHSHEHAMSHDASKGTIVLKHFSCVISSKLKIFACCKKHMSYFSSGYQHLIKPDLFTISLASKLLKCDEIFVILDFLMTVKIISIFFLDKNAQ